MKRALQLATCCVISGAAALIARGDNSALPLKPAAPGTAPGASIAEQSTPMTAVSSPQIAPSAADSIDFSNTDPEQVAAQTMQLRAQRMENVPTDLEVQEEQQRQLDQHDWMLRGYQEQLQKNGLEKAPVVDPYTAANKNTLADPTVDASSPDQQDADDQARKRASTPDNSDKDISPVSSILPTELKPLLPPIDAPQKPAGTTATYFGDTSNEDVPPVSDTSPVIPTDPNSDSSLDIPGMTAAQEGMPKDLSLDDRLPDEPPDTAAPREDRDVFALPTAPANDADAFFKKQNESLMAPNAPTFRALVTAPTTPAYTEPVRPPAKPVIDGLRIHVADPLDYLNR